MYNCAKLKLLVLYKGQAILYSAFAYILSHILLHAVVVFDFCKMCVFISTPVASFFTTTKRAALTRDNDLNPIHQDAPVRFVREESVFLKA